MGLGVGGGGRGGFLLVVEHYSFNPSMVALGVAVKVRLPEKLLSPSGKPPVALFVPLKFHLATGGEGVVIAPYSVHRYHGDRGKDDGTVVESCILLLRQEDGAFTLVRPVKRLSLLSFVEVDVGVDVYRSSDVPDDVVAVHANVSVGKDGVIFDAYVQGDFDQKKERQLKLLLEQYVTATYGKESRLFFNFYSCQSPVQALGAASSDKESGEKCIPYALRLPPGHEYIILPERWPWFTTALVVGRGGRWTFSLPHGVLEQTVGVRLEIHEHPPPEDGYILFLVTDTPISGYSEVGAQAKRVRVLDYRLPPDKEINIRELTQQVYEALVYGCGDWYIAWWELENAIREAIS